MEGFKFIDIILFAMIAAFLVLRLRGVLGRRDGHEGGYHDRFKSDSEPRGETDEGDDNVVQLPDRSSEVDGDVGTGAYEAAADLGKDAGVASGAWAGGETEAGLTQIALNDSSFDAQEFVIGARVAFEMILDAYAAGDAATLKPLLSPEVYANFAKAIDDREKAGETMEDTLVGIKSSDIVEAYMEGRDANLTIKFVTEQVNVTRDESGDVVDGNPNAVAEVTDFWTFARDTRSNNPNWTLVATRSLD